MKDIKVLEVVTMPSLNGGYIFNSSSFHELKTTTYRFFVLYEKNKVISRISFYCNGSEAVSGQGATFGSFDSDEVLEVEKVVYFIKSFVALLFSSGIKKIGIRLPPSAYPEVGFVEEQLRKENFEISATEVNQQLIISEESFKDRIRYNEKKKLKQSLRAGYVATELGIDSLPEVYQLVANTRNRKGYPISMTYEELLATIIALPSHYLIFGLFDKDVLIAATISIRVADNILYNFYHADKAEYRTHSPLVMLVGTIYKYCQEQRIELLDLGISSNRGELNEG